MILFINAYSPWIINTLINIIIIIPIGITIASSKKMFIYLLLLVRHSKVSRTGLLATVPNSSLRCTIRIIDTLGILYISDTVKRGYFSRCFFVCARILSIMLRGQISHTDETEFCVFRRVLKYNVKMLCLEMFQF